MLLPSDRLTDETRECPEAERIQHKWPISARPSHYTAFSHLGLLENEQVSVIVAVQELEVELDRFFSSQDSDDSLFVQLCSLFWWCIGGRRCYFTSLETGANDLEEFLRGSLGQVESDLIGGQDSLVTRRG